MIAISSAYLIREGRGVSGIEGEIRGDGCIDKGMPAAVKCRCKEWRKILNIIGDNVVPLEKLERLNRYLKGWRNVVGTFGVTKKGGEEMGERDY